MAGHGFVRFGWSWIEASGLGSQVFGQASMEGCKGRSALQRPEIAPYFLVTIKYNNCHATMQISRILQQHYEKDYCLLDPRFYR